MQRRFEIYVLVLYCPDWTKIRMNFCDEIEKQYKGLRQAILAHPFVSGIGDGSLAVERFNFYVRQD